jgi:hypothetical protein
VENCPAYSSSNKDIPPVHEKHLLPEPLPDIPSPDLSDFLQKILQHQAPQTPAHNRSTPEKAIIHKAPV